MAEEKPKTIRSFIALEISDEARSEIARIENIIKEVGADVKWVKPESIHLTLKFLGHIPEDKVEAISGKIEKIASGNGPFEMKLSEVGVFPKWNYPRVLWIGIKEGAENIQKLAGLVEDAMAEVGFEKEKRSFSPHLTIGRVRSPKNKEKLEKSAGKIKVKDVTSYISKIVLFKSKLTPEGAIYTPLVTANLAG